MASKRLGKPRSSSARNGDDAVHPAHEHPKSEIESASGLKFFIAFKGEVELINAKWDLESGRTVTFRIGGNGFDRLHPFKRFQKKRAGKVGSRFAAAIVDQHGVIRVNTEVMLKDWTESSSGGQQFSLWLDDEATLHPFAGCRHRKRDEPGEMFKISLLEIEDDESLTPQEATVKTRNLSSEAHLLVTGSMFVQYLKETKTGTAKWDPNLSKQYVKAKLGIESLSILDRIPAKAQEYREKIIKPYEQWRGGHG